MIIHHNNNTGKNNKSNGTSLKVKGSSGVSRQQTHVDEDDFFSLIAEHETNSRADHDMLNDNDEDLLTAEYEDDDDDDDDRERDSGNSSKCSSSEFSSFNSIKTSDKQHKQAHHSGLFVMNDDEDEDYIDESIAPNTASPSACQKKIEIDLTLVDQDRTLNSLLNLEDYYRVDANYFIHMQNEIKPWMRKMLATWMLEVCKNQGKEEDVFVLAMNILDRFLSVQQIGKRHLQLLGTVSMFLASKMRSSSQFNAETLVIYTANSITIEELLVSP
jgi:hypothetical protein